MSKKRLVAIGIRRKGEKKFTVTTDIEKPKNTVTLPSKMHETNTTVS